MKCDIEMNMFQFIYLLLLKCSVNLQLYKLQCVLAIYLNLIHWVLHVFGTFIMILLRKHFKVMYIMSSIPEKISRLVFDMNSQLVCIVQCTKLFSILTTEYGIFCQLSIFGPPENHFMYFSNSSEVSPWCIYCTFCWLLDKSKDS